MKITVPGKPIAKARPRFVRRGSGVYTYNGQQTEEGKWLLSARSQITHKINRPIGILLSFYLPRPKCHYGIGKNADKLKASAPHYPDKKPDLDNLIKFVLDCLNGEAWDDDKQIVSIEADKYYTGKDPQTVIYITEF